MCMTSMQIHTQSKVFEHEPRRMLTKFGYHFTGEIFIKIGEPRFLPFWPQKHPKIDVQTLKWPPGGSKFSKDFAIFVFPAPKSFPGPNFMQIGEKIVGPPK